MTIEEELAAAKKRVAELESELRAALERMKPKPEVAAPATARQVEQLAEELREARKELADLKKWKAEKEPPAPPAPPPKKEEPAPAPKKDWTPWGP